MANPNLFYPSILNFCPGGGIPCRKNEFGSKPHPWDIHWVPSFFKKIKNYSEDWKTPSIEHFDKRDT